MLNIWFFIKVFLLIIQILTCTHKNCSKLCYKNITRLTLKKKIHFILNKNKRGIKYHPLFSKVGLKLHTITDLHSFKKWGSIIQSINCHFSLTVPWHSSSFKLKYFQVIFTVLYCFSSSLIFIKVFRFQRKTFLFFYWFSFL